MSSNDAIVKRILVVDDNEGVLTIVANILHQAGYGTWLATDGEQALQIIERRGMPHLVVLDINMPGMDGLALGQRLRELSDVPIIMLTARSQDRDITQALDDFADDYVVKPFMTRELVVRIDRVLRRVADYSYTVDEKASLGSHLEIDFTSRQVTVAGNPVSLTPTEAKILQILFERGGRTVTTDMLIRQVWPFENVPEQRLRVHVSRLRRKLQHDSETDYIVAERGMGYRLQD